MVETVIYLLKVVLSVSSFTMVSLIMIDITTDIYIKNLRKIVDVSYAISMLSALVLFILFLWL